MTLTVLSQQAPTQQASALSTSGSEHQTTLQAGWPLRWGGEAPNRDDHLQLC